MAIQKKSQSDKFSILRDRILFTLFIIILTRLGVYIPIPGIDRATFTENISSLSLVKILNVFNGGGFSTVGIFSLGIIPYINASIITQLLTPVVPSLSRLQKEEGERGREELQQITRYITLFWSFGQSLFLTSLMKPFVFDWTTFFLIKTALTLTVGSLLVMFFAEQITENGVGNGSSLIIFVNIVASFPRLFEYKGLSLTNLLLLFLCLSITIFCIVLVQESILKVGLISARQLKENFFADKSNFIPLKMNQGGMMPLIFASSLLNFFSFLLSKVPNLFIISLITAISTSVFSRATYLISFFILILFFSYIYINTIFDTDDIAKNLQKMTATIVGIKPGRETSQYLQKVMNRLTVLGTIFLTLITILPISIDTLIQIPISGSIGPTSFLILVSVAIETSNQIQTYLLSFNYDEGQ